MTYPIDTYVPHWLDGMCCTPGTHDDRHDRETDAHRDRRHEFARAVCGRCPVDKDRCLKNGIKIRGDGVYAGHLLENGVPRPKRPEKAA